MKPKKNSLIIIGNGFDLAHKLETSYQHFIDHFWKDVITERIGYKNRYPEKANYSSFLQIKNQLNSPNRNWSEEIKNISDNSFLQKLSDKRDLLPNWVNIENEYYQALILCKDNKQIIKLNNEFSFIQNELEKYLTKQAKKEIEPVKKVKSHLDTIFSSLMERMEPSRVMFLNFNYTKTEEIYLNNYYKTYQNKVECIHIHGELNNPQNPIIFGYGDELDDNYHDIETKNDNTYLENIKSMKYFQTRNYQKLLLFIERNIPFEIFIMGHSCGNSDRTLLNTLFQHKNCESIKVFYHQKDKSDDFTDKIMNISRNFEDKKQMRKIVEPKIDCLPMS